MLADQATTHGQAVSAGGGLRGAEVGAAAFVPPSPDSEAELVAVPKWKALGGDRWRVEVPFGSAAFNKYLLVPWLPAKHTTQYQTKHVPHLLHEQPGGWYDTHFHPSVDANLTKLAEQEQFSVERVLGWSDAGSGEPRVLVKWLGFTLEAVDLSWQPLSMTTSASIAAWAALVGLLQPLGRAIHDLTSLVLPAKTPEVRLSVHADRAAPGSTKRSERRTVSRWAGAALPALRRVHKQLQETSQRLASRGEPDPDALAREVCVWEPGLTGLQEGLQEEAGVLTGVLASLSLRKRLKSTTQALQKFLQAGCGVLEHTLSPCFAWKAPARGAQTLDGPLDLDSPTAAQALWTEGCMRGQEVERVRTWLSMAAAPPTASAAATGINCRLHQWLDAALMGEEGVSDRVSADDAHEAAWLAEDIGREVVSLHFNWCQRMGRGMAVAARVPIHSCFLSPPEVFAAPLSIPSDVEQLQQAAMAAAQQSMVAHETWAERYVPGAAQGGAAEFATQLGNPGGRSALQSNSSAPTARADTHTLQKKTGAANPSPKTPVVPPPVKLGGHKRLRLMDVLQDAKSPPAASPGASSTSPGHQGTGRKKSPTAGARDVAHRGKQKKRPRESTLPLPGQAAADPGQQVPSAASGTVLGAGVGSVGRSGGEIRSLASRGRASHPPRRLPPFSSHPGGGAATRPPPSTFVLPSVPLRARAAPPLAALEGGVVVVDDDDGDGDVSPTDPAPGPAAQGVRPWAGPEVEAGCEEGVDKASAWQLEAAADWVPYGQRSSASRDLALSGTVEDLLATARCDREADSHVYITDTSRAVQREVRGEFWSRRGRAALGGMAATLSAKGSSASAVSGTVIRGDAVDLSETPDMVTVLELLPAWSALDEPALVDELQASARLLPVAPADRRGFCDLPMKAEHAPGRSAPSEVQVDWAQDVAAAAALPQALGLASLQHAKWLGKESSMPLSLQV